MQLDTANGSQIMYLMLDNSGNVMLKPSGDLIIQDAQGSPVQHIQFYVDTLLPETTIHYPVAIKRLANGKYRAIVTLTYGHHRALSLRMPLEIGQTLIGTVAIQAQVKAFAANPLWILLVGCLVSLLAISFCFRAIKRKRTL